MAVGFLAPDLDLGAICAGWIDNGRVVSGVTMGGRRWEIYRCVMTVSGVVDSGKLKADLLVVIFKFWSGFA